MAKPTKHKDQKKSLKQPGECTIQIDPKLPRSRLDCIEERLEAIEKKLGLPTHSHREQ